MATAQSALMKLTLRCRSSWQDWFDHWWVSIKCYVYKEAVNFVFTWLKVKPYDIPISFDKCETLRGGDQNEYYGSLKK